MSRRARNGSRLQIDAGNFAMSGPRRRNRLFGSRHRARRPVLVALAALACVFGSLLFVGISAATGPSKGSNVPGAAAAQGTFVTGPFDSGQLVNIVIPANSVLAPNQKIFVLECAAPNGVNPVTIDDCDGNTNYSSGTISANADGSVDLNAAGKRLYPIYALPDHVTLGETTGPANCGVGAANECVLYIGQGGGSDTGLSQPYFFSQPFQVHADPTDSGTLNPGDGSSAPVSPVSPTLSTVTPPTQTVAADGADPATVTVTLEDTNSVGVAGKAVSLTAESGSSSITPVTAGGVTNANGQVSFTATDSTPETVTYRAEDTTDSIPLTATSQVVFAPETVNTVASSVAADPTSVPADGSSSSTITVTLLDKPVNGSPQPMADRTVALTAEGGSSVIVPASSGSNVTGSNGQATFSVTDTQNEPVIYKATDTTDSVTLTATATVTFGVQAPVSASASTITASPSPAFTGVGGGTTVTVTLLTSSQSPVVGKTVSLSVSSSSGKAAVGSANPQVTGSNGQATFEVADSVAESVSLSAVDTTDDNLQLAAKPVVVFKAPPPPTVSAQNSQVIVNGSPEPADGTSDVVVEVIVVNTLGADVPGVTVSMTSTPSGTAIVTPIGAGGVSPGETDAHGTTEFSVHDTAAETVTLTTTVHGATPVTLTARPTATFVAGPANATTSTVSASPVAVAADGTAASTVTVTLEDYFGNPVAGKVIALNAANGASVVSPVQVVSSTLPGVTDAQGVARFSVTDATTEVVSYTATDTTDNLSLAQQASVTFGTPPPVRPVVADSDIVVNASKVPADGKTDATITVELRDANGHPVAGKTVTISASGGSSVVKATTASSGAQVTGAHSVTGPQSASRPLAASPTAVTNSNGVAIFDATDTVPETVVYSADDQTDSMTGWKVTVTFTAATPSTTTTSSTTTTTVAATAATSSPGAGSAETAGTDTGGTGTGTASSTTDTGTSGSSNPDLAFTGAPTALPWLVGAGLFCLLIGMLGRRLLLTRRRDP